MEGPSRSALKPWLSIFTVDLLSNLIVQPAWYEDNRNYLRGPANQGCLTQLGINVKPNTFIGAL